MKKKLHHVRCALVVTTTTATHGNRRSGEKVATHRW